MKAKINFAKIVDSFNGGLTQSINGIETPKQGYMVSLSGYEVVKKYSTIDFLKAVKTYVRDNHDKLQDERNFLGIWLEGDYIYFDVSRHYMSLKRAVIEGLKGNQLAIYDLDFKDVIYLPEMQKSGTETQKQSYYNLVLRRVENAQFQVNGNRIYTYD